MSQKQKIVVAMSGGVDSSVAAAKLLRAGHEVVGVFMRLGGPDGVASNNNACDTNAKQGCCSVRDADDARQVAAQLHIPFYVLNFQEDFGRVIDYFVAEYNRGRTPNPCVRCNDWLKFGKLADYARAVGADAVASGHYARIGQVNGQPALLRGLDEKKDQSYVLFGMSRPALDHTLLPIGELHKQQVRDLARQWGLPVFDKPDSQEICFVPDQDYAGLVRRKTPEKFADGAFVDAQGRQVGRHGGHQHFTIGQRKGLRLAMGKPDYVTGRDAAANTVTIGDRQQLLRDGLIASQVNVLSDRLGPEPIGCTVKIRYNHAPQPARAWLQDQMLHVRFEQPQSAITPGQAAVVYDADQLLGGGWIDSCI